MEEVINQAPEHISREDIEIIFKKNNENVLDTLIDLWSLDVSKKANVCDLDENKETVIDIKNEVNKWANIRNICDSYDLEMQTQLNRIKNNNKKI
jgi:hypothetical protein